MSKISSVTPTPPSGQVAGRDPLGKGDDVRHDVVLLHAEHLAGATEATNDLVEDEQDVVLLQHVGHRLPVTLRGHEDATTAVDRLPDHGRDRALALARDRLF